MGLEAFARCYAQVATSAASLREAFDLEPMAALRAAMRPFDRLAAPPPGVNVTLHGTNAAEVAAELQASDPFVSALVRAVGCPSAVAALLSESSVDTLAGRLVLNAAGIQVLGSGPGGLALRAAGIFVLVSTMNHSCVPTAEAVFGASSAVTLRTTRDVGAGEPLTLSYVSPELALAPRRERLRHWFFECDCALCETQARISQALLRRRDH